jgi:hypothetical protein
MHGRCASSGVDQTISPPPGMLSTASHKDHTYPLGKPNYRLHCFAILQRKIPNDSTSFEALREVYKAYKVRGNACDRVVSYYSKQLEALRGWNAIVPRRRGRDGGLLARSPG